MKYFLEYSMLDFRGKFVLRKVVKFPDYDEMDWEKETMNFRWLDLQITNFIQHEDGTSSPAGFVMDKSTHQVSWCRICHRMYMLTQEQWRKAEHFSMLNNDGIHPCSDCEREREWRDLIHYTFVDVKKQLEGYLDDRDFILEYFGEWQGFDNDYYMGDLFPHVLEVREYKGLRELQEVEEFITFEYVSSDYRGNEFLRYVPIVEDIKYPIMESLL